MLLSPILDEIARDDELRALADSLDRSDAGAAHAVEGVPAAARAVVLGALARLRERPMLVVVSRQDVAARLHESLACYLADGEELFLWPAQDALPYEQLPVDPVASAQRLAILTRLLDARDGGGAPVLVVSARGLQGQLMSPEHLRRHRQVLRPGDRLNVGPTLSRWLDLGYEPVTAVEEPGQFSRRGGLIDVYPPGADGPGG